MLSLHHVFSDNALFQQEAMLTVHGNCDTKTNITWELTCGETCFASGTTAMEFSNKFEFSFTTPKGSRDVYTLKVANEKEQLTVNNIQFGELWFAGGQSNMELPLSAMRDREAFYASIEHCDIRAYQSNPFFAMKGWAPNMDYPEKEQEDFEGFWVTTKDHDKIMDVSALALSAAKELAQKLDMPVGFINCNLGGTMIETWLPYHTIAWNFTLLNIIEDMNRYPWPDKYNTFGDANYQQPCALYNLVVAPLDGIKTRGMWWYQGESNVEMPDSKVFYKEALLELHAVYAKKFGTREGFPILCSLLYAWCYGEVVGKMNEINQAFIETAKREPDDFMVVPNYDLPPIWAVNRGNHPIHPAHKIELGKRFAMQTMRAVYGERGLKSAVYAKSCKTKGDHIIVTFDTIFHSLTAKGELRNFFVAGEWGGYLPAKAEIISEDSISIFCADIARPVSAMYQYMDLEYGGNLYCDDIPVAPFMTYREKPHRMSSLHWLDFSNDSVWVVDVHDDVLNGNMRPLWTPIAGSGLCRDTIFTRSGCAMRISGDTDNLGAVVKAYPALPLNLWEFTELRFSIFNAQDVTATIELAIKQDENEVETKTIACKSVTVLDEDWSEVAFDLQQEEADILEMRLLFTVKRPVKGVTIDCMRLIPKTKGGQ